jgi:hypothetical protein
VNYRTGLEKFILFLIICVGVIEMGLFVRWWIG